MSLLGALIGLVIAAGILLVVAGLRPARPHSATTDTGAGRPPTRAQRRLSAARRSLTRRDQAIIAAAAALGLLIALTTGWLVALVLVPLIAWGLPRALFPPKSADIDVLEAMGEWTRRLASLIDTGHHLVDTLAQSLASCPEAIRPSVQHLVDRLRARASAESAIRAWADEVNDETADTIAGALITGATANSSALAVVLKDLADMVSHEVTGRRTIAVAQAAPGSEMRWVTVLSVAGLAGLVFLLPYGHFYFTPAGQVALTGITAGFVAVIIWMRRIATPPPVPRFLTKTGAH